MLDSTAAKIIQYYWKDLCDGKTSIICHGLEISAAEYSEAISCLSVLNPFPLNGFFDRQNNNISETNFLIPDIIVSQSDDDYKIIINDSFIPNYEISDYYLKAYNAEKNPELKAYYEEKYTRAKNLIYIITKRHEIAENISSCAIRVQKDFLLNKGDLKPFSIKQLSNLSKISYSIVARYVSHTFIQAPIGCIKFKSLFTSNTGKISSLENQDELLTNILSLIKNEDKANHLSDESISMLLNEQGIIASRKKVQKKREEHAIPNSFQRAIK